MTKFESFVNVAAIWRLSLGILFPLFFSLLVVHLVDSLLKHFVDLARCLPVDAFPFARGSIILLWLGFFGLGTDITSALAGLVLGVLQATILFLGEPDLRAIALNHGLG